MKILVTGAAGFIGAAVAHRLLERGDEVVGLDNLNAYYDVSLKEDRLSQLSDFPRFHFRKCDLADSREIEDLFTSEKPQRVVNLAAQAGGRHSLKAPHSYIESNVKGFLNILEGCRHIKVEHLVYASSSSVYGADGSLPFAEGQGASHPVSLYGATKRINELMAHSYSHLFQTPRVWKKGAKVEDPAAV